MDAGNSHSSSKKEPPRLVITRHEDCTLQAVIHADEITVDCDGSSMFEFLLNLQAAYYAWDLSYPTTYQLLTFFQAHVLKDNQENNFKSNALTKLEKALKLCA